MLVLVALFGLGFYAAMAGLLTGHSGAGIAGAGVMAIVGAIAVHILRKR